MNSIKNEELSFVVQEIVLYMPDCKRIMCGAIHVINYYVLRVRLLEGLCLRVFRARYYLIPLKQA